jgi:hypothetical protein
MIINETYVEFIIVNRITEPSCARVQNILKFLNSYVRDVAISINYIEIMRDSIYIEYNTTDTLYKWILVEKIQYYNL